MAPLVPNIISPEFNFVIALIVGIGFGYALEQAGFSSSRKLVGLFYGYDFTVLKVFFTAGVTAMVGVLLFGHLGVLNLDVIYVNPTFLWPAIIGGLIMGAGFIIGGFCPGTSICAAAVGRLDAMAFIVGSVIGILFFMEGFPAIEPLYMAGEMGPLRINEVFGISAEFFGIILAIVAVAAFYFTSKIEDSVNDRDTAISTDKKKLYTGMAIVPVIVILLIWITPSRQEYVWNQVEEKAANEELNFEVLGINELAFELVHHAHEYNVIDVRDTSAFKNTIPTAINIPIEEMGEEAWKNVFIQPYKKNIFIGDTEELVKKAAVYANIIGDDNPIIFSESVGAFKEAIYEAEYPGEQAPKDVLNEYRFRENAKNTLIRLEERLKNLKKPIKTIIETADGGCS